MITLKKRNQKESALVFFYCNNQDDPENEDNNKKGQKQEKQDVPEKYNFNKAFNIRDGEFVLEFLRSKWQPDDGVTLKLDIQ